MLLMNAKACLLDAVERIFYQGIPDAFVDNQLQEIVNRAVELLPELLKLDDCYPEAISAYRSALLSQWNLDNDCCARIQKRFAVFLMYSGVEATPPSLAVQIDGSYVPRNNLEEAILLLMILMRKFYLGKTPWGPSVIEHPTYALSLCSQTSVTSVMPGLLHRVDRWKLLSLCLSGSGQNEAALNLLRKSLHRHENPDDVMSLLLAAKICSEDSLFAAEGVGYAQRAINNARGANTHLKGVGLHMLGLCMGKQAKLYSSDFERSRLQSEALKSLDGAIYFEPNNSDLIFELGVQLLRGWRRLLALVLSAQQRFSVARVVFDAGTAKWEQGPLLRMKAKLKISVSTQGCC